MAVEQTKPPIIRTNPDSDSWHAIDAQAVLARLETMAESGLSPEEAARRLEQYGYNQLREAPPITFWQMLWGQLNNFVVIMLIVAAIISAVLGDQIEAIAIMAIVILNAALGVVQERRAEQALAALRKLAAPEAHVIRGGSRQSIPSGMLVPGDIVLLESGNYVPADVRLLDAVNLRVDEAALTGESVPVQKNAAVSLEADIPIGDRKNTAFLGTLVSYGRGKGIVVSTGMLTQIGLIAEMLQAVEQEPTPLQRRLDQLGKMLGWAALSICALVFLVGWLRGYNPLDMFLISVGLAIAAVPEGLRLW
jgi:Ca2+-transporting ATPase